MLPETQKIEIANLTKSDYENLKKVMIKCYGNMSQAYWRKEKIDKLIDIFPQGQFGAYVNDELVGAALTLIVDYKKFTDNHTYREITADYTFDSHTENGDVLYGIDIFIDPDYRGLRLGRRLYDARKELCEQLNLKSILAGGRIPNYNQYANQMTPKEYLAAVKRKEIFDPVLYFQLGNDFHVKKVLRGYLEGDKESLEYATLLEWNNIYYAPSENPLDQKKSIVRLGLVQWQMRLFKDSTALYEQIEFFVDTVSGYNCDFVLFPELFNAPLMAKYNHLSESDAIRELSAYTLDLRDKFAEYAISYNINIITGSMPLMEDGKLYNVGYLCKRDGGIERYDKVHITPNERFHWGMVGGNKIQAFDTDCGKIGIAICYDVEFPELSRLLAKQGMQILFVPFLTDTQNGYTRVRSCAQARAIENECYVAIAGSVGNLPKVANMDIQFAQSAVFTPSDFSFPTNGVKAETTPNTEMTLIVDVDIDLLKQLHSFGSVQIMQDRRTDLYDVQSK